MVRGSGWLAVILAFGVAGCVVMVPERRTTSQIVSVEHSPLIVGPAGEIALIAESTRGRIDVHTVRHRACHRQSARVVERRSKRVAKIESSSDMNLSGATAPGILVWIAAMPVVFAVSAMITSVVVAVDGTEVARSPEQGGVDRFPCPAQAPGTRLEVALPSGARMMITSDALGRSTFMIPQAEPAEGEVTVRAIDAPDPAPPRPPDPDRLVEPTPTLPPGIPVVTVHYDARG